MQAARSSTAPLFARKGVQNGGLLSAHPAFQREAGNSAELPLIVSDENRSRVQRVSGAQHVHGPDWLSLAFEARPQCTVNVSSLSRPIQHGKVVEKFRKGRLVLSGPLRLHHPCPQFRGDDARDRSLAWRDCFQSPAHLRRVVLYRVDANVRIQHEELHQSVRLLSGGLSSISSGKSSVKREARSKYSLKEAGRGVRITRSPSRSMKTSSQSKRYAFGILCRLPFHIDTYHRYISISQAEINPHVGRLAGGSARRRSRLVIACPSRSPMNMQAGHRPRRFCA